MLLTVASVLGISLLRGGSLQGFSQIRLHWSWLVVLGLVIQLIIFTPLRPSFLQSAIPALYLLSMLLVIGWVAVNWRIPGMWLMALGLLSNTLAIAANGGYMPVDPAMAAITGRLEHYASSSVVNNSLVTTTAQLWLLTDILPLPAWFPFANVFSIGDVLITLGACFFCYRMTQCRTLAVQRDPTSAVVGEVPASGGRRR